MGLGNPKHERHRDEARHWTRAAHDPNGWEKVFPIEFEVQYMTATWDDVKLFNSVVAAMPSDPNTKIDLYAVEAKLTSIISRIGAEKDRDTPQRDRQHGCVWQQQARPLADIVWMEVWRSRLVVRFLTENRPPLGCSVTLVLDPRLRPGCWRSGCAGLVLFLCADSLLIGYLACNFLGPKAGPDTRRLWTKDGSTGFLVLSDRWVLTRPNGSSTWMECRDAQSGKVNWSESGDLALVYPAQGNSPLMLARRAPGSVEVLRFTGACAKKSLVNCADSPQASFASVSAYQWYVVDRSVFGFSSARIARIDLETWSTTIVPNNLQVPRNPPESDVLVQAQWAKPVGNRFFAECGPMLCELVPSTGASIEVRAHGAVRNWFVAPEALYVVREASLEKERSIRRWRGPSRLNRAGTSWTSEPPLASSPLGGRAARAHH